MATIELNVKAFNVSLGKAGEIEVDVEKLVKSEAVVAYIFQYGLKQMLNDVHASEKDPAAKIGLSQKKLDSLYRGEVAQQRVGGGGDPVKREMLAMAKQDVNAKIKALGKKLGDYDKETLNSVYEKQMAANESQYRKAAEAKLAIKPEKAELDLADLGL